MEVRFHIQNIFTAMQKSSRGHRLECPDALIQRRGVGLPTLISARSRGKRFMSKRNYALLEQRLFELTLSCTGTRLPNAITFPYPPSNEPDTTARPLLSFIHAIHRDIPVHACVKEYLRSVTRLVAKRAHQLGEFLCVKGTKHSWAELQAANNRDCTCASLPQELPRVSGGVVVRTLHGMHELDPFRVPILAQCMANAILNTEDTYITWVYQASHRLAKGCPFFPQSWAQQLTAHFCNLASLAYKNAIRNMPPSLHLDRIVAVKPDINRHFVILPLDKHAGKPALMCRRLYAWTLLDQYGYTTQFATIADCLTPADARNCATQHIYQRAVPHNVAQHYQLGRRFVPSSSFVSMKKKSMESHGTVSMRILFTHY